MYHAVLNCSKYHRQLLKTVWNCDVSKITYSFHIRHVHLIPSTIWIKWSILTVQCWIYCSQRVRPNAWFYSCEEDIPFFRLFSYHFSLNWKPKCAALKNFVRIVHGRKVLCLNLHMTYIPNESERGSLLILRSTAWTIHSQHSRLDLNSLTNCMQEITYTPPATANSSEFGERKKRKTQRKRRRVIFYYDLSCAVCVFVWLPFHMFAKQQENGKYGVKRERAHNNERNRCEYMWLFCILEYEIHPRWEKFAIYCIKLQF